MILGIFELGSKVELKMGIILHVHGNLFKSFAFIGGVVLLPMGEEKQRLIDTWEYELRVE